MITWTYENNIIAADMNIDFSDRKNYSNSYLIDLCETFSKKNLISGETCVKYTKGCNATKLVKQPSQY